MTSRQPVFLRRHPVGSVVAALVVLLVAFVVLFDWNWVRPSIERYISKRTEREFHSSDLHVKLGLTPTIQLRDVYFGNAKWSKEAPAMARIEMTMVRASPWRKGGPGVSRFFQKNPQSKFTRQPFAV